MAVGDTAFYRTNTGVYRAMEDTGADTGLIQGGYTKFKDINDYQSAIQGDLKRYQDLASQLDQSSWGGLTYKGGQGNYSGNNPFDMIKQLQGELGNIQARQGIYGQGYNTGAQTVNGNYTTAGSIAQEKSYQDAVKAGTMQQTMVNGVATYLPTQAPSMASLNTPVPPASGRTAALPGYATDASGYQSAYPTINLQPGQSGDNVKALQQYLISLGYSIPAGATGFYGTQTQAAVKALQEKMGVDYGSNPGFFGPKTQAALSQMGLNLNPNASVGGPKVTQGTSGITGAVKDRVDGMSAIPSSALGSSMDTSSVTGKRDTYQSMLEQYTQNQKNIADTQAKIAALNTQFAQGQTAIQGQTIPTGLEGAQAQAMKEQIAFQQLPLTQQLDSYIDQAKILKEQSGASQEVENQARQTFFNLSQQNPSVHYDYNTGISALENLQAMRMAIDSTTQSNYNFGTSDMLNKAASLGYIPGKTEKERLANAQRISNLSPEQQESTIKTLLFNNMGVSQQASFELNQKAIATADQALSIFSSNPDMVNNPYKYTANNYATFLGGEKDPRYTNFVQMVEATVAPIRQSYFGASLTSGEQNAANRFLPDTLKDDAKTLVMKLENTKAIARWVNDTMLANKLGSDKPKLDDYITVSEKTGASQTVSNPSGSIKTGEDWSW